MSKLLTNKHFPLTSSTVVELLVVLMVTFCASRWMWNRFVGSPPSNTLQLLTQPKHSPLAYYRMMGRFIGLFCAYSVSAWFWVYSSSMGTWVALFSRLISIGVSTLFCIHLIGVLEDGILLTKNGPEGITDQALIAGSMSRAIRLFQKLWWDGVLWDHCRNTISETLLGPSPQSEYASAGEEDDWAIRSWGVY